MLLILIALTAAAGCSSSAEPPARDDSGAEADAAIESVDAQAPADAGPPATSGDAGLAADDAGLAADDAGLAADDAGPAARDVGEAPSADAAFDAGHGSADALPQDTGALIATEIDGCIEGWCFEYPTSSPARLSSVRAFSPSDVWAVGLEHVVLHFNGTRWQRLQIPGLGLVWAIWGASPTDLWIVEFHGRVLRGDGSTWRVAAAPSMAGARRIWGSDANNIWVVGDRGLAQQFDGVAWHDRSPGMLTQLWDVWGTAANDMWLVGDGVFHWNGARMSSHSFDVPSSGMPRDLKAVWGTAPNDVWIAGESGVLNHFAGARFNLVPSALRVNFTAGTTVRNGSVYVGSTSAIYRVTSSGVVETTPLIGSPLAMTSFDDEAWAVGHGGGIAHLSGGQWTEQVRTVGFPLLDVHGSAVDNVWAVGPEPLGLLIHYDGRTWSRDVPTANLIEPYLDRVWVVSSTDAWAFGAHRPLGSASFVNLVLRYDGRHWNQVATPNRNRVNAACATGGQVFTVGDLGETARFDGTRWSILSSTTTRDLLSVHCSSPTDVWASVYLPVGPALVHWDGNAWSFDHGGPTEFVSSFVGSATDLFAFGARQWHYDGRQWTAGPNLPQRMSIVGTDPNDLWALSLGNLWHFDGTSWSASAFGVEFSGFNGLWAHGSDVFGVGKFIARHR